MESIFKILMVVSIFNLGNLVTAQTFGTLNTANTISGFDTEASQGNFLINQAEVFKTNLSSENNTVIIAQIGDDNNLNSTTKSLKSTVTIVQNGNGNDAFLELNNKELLENIIQNGNNNAVLDYSLYQSNLRNTEINQTGNNQNLTISGSNSLSEKMKVSMQGQDQTIIIRNF